MKKLRLILSMVLLIAFGLISIQANAQRAKGGVPPTFSLKKEAQALPTQAYAKMPVKFSVTELLAEDEFNARNEISRPRIAKLINADMNMENSGVWEELPNGQRVWRLAIEAVGAKALILNYDEFYLPAGSQLFLYNKQKNQVIGAYDNTTNRRGTHFSTPLVAGDVTILEYVEPLAKTGDEPRISIKGVGYGYNHISVVDGEGNELNLNPAESNMQKTTTGCYVNVICPDANSMRDQVTSVCQMTMLNSAEGGWMICTGTLVNNTANDKKPYIISAWHCYEGSTAQDMLSWQFYFFYESTVCATNTATLSNMEALVGAELRTSIPLNGGSDGLLVELIEPIPNAWLDGSDPNHRIVFSGWDRREIAPVNGFGIHHPNGVSKKIVKFGAVSLSGNANFGTNGVTGTNSNWATTSVRHTDTNTTRYGCTEGGSSGSGLFNTTGLLMGTLSGGPTSTTCTSAASNTYGALSAHWEKFGTSPANQMKMWLDPVCDGTAEICAPFPNNAGIDLSVDFVADRTTLNAMESTTFSTLNTCIFDIDSLKWEFQSGTPLTSTDVNPTITYNTPGTFDVKITIWGKDKTRANADTIVEVEKLLYIDVISATIPPVANFTAYDFIPQATRLVEDNGGARSLNGGTFTNTSVSSSGSTSTYVKATVSGAPASLASSTWTRTNYGNTTATGLTGYGYGYSSTSTATDAYFYTYFDNTYPATGVVRMYNRAALNFAGSYEKARLRLKFKNVSWDGDADAFVIQYSNTTTAGSEWKTIYQTTQVTLENTGSTGTTGWIDIDVELPNLTSTYYVGFVAIGGSGYGMGIDNIEIVAYDAVAEPHVYLWEGDDVDFYNLATGDPVTYDYTFEGGNPATSTSNAPIINVRYDEEGLFDVSQTVANNLGDSTLLRDDYVTVYARVLETDTTLIQTECNDGLTTDIILTANKDWQVISSPSWVTLSHYSGTVATPGVPEDLTITVTVAPQTKSVGRNDKIVFRTNDKVLKTEVKVKQAAATPTGLTVTKVPVGTTSTNAKLTWDDLGCIVHEDLASECDVILVGGGDFEEHPITNGWQIFTEGGTLTGYTAGWLWSYPDATSANSGDGAMLSFSYENYVGEIDADNWLVSPKLKVTEDYKTLTYYVASADPGYPDSYEVRLSTQSTITSVSDFGVIIKNMSVAPGGYTKVSIDLTAHVGEEIFVAFRHQHEDGYALLIDDVSGLELASCDVTTSAMQTQSTSATSSSKIQSLKNVSTMRRMSKDGFVTTTSNSNKVDRNELGNNKLERMPADLAMAQSLMSSVNEPMLIGVDNINVGGAWTTAYSLNMQAEVDTKVAIRINEDEAAEYSCSMLTAITFGMYGNGTSVTTAFGTNKIELFAMRGNTVLFTQEVDPSELASFWGPSTIQLTTPVSLAGAGDLRIGYSIPKFTPGVAPNTGPWPISVAGPYVDGGGDIFVYGRWWTFAEQASGLPSLFLTAHTELDGVVGSYNVYRQRQIHGVPTGSVEKIAQGVEAFEYLDEDVMPGGEYCYWVTLSSARLESCPSDTNCVFIPFKQSIQVQTPITRVYGDAPFEISKLGAGTNGRYVRSTADAQDYFAGRTIPVELDVYAGTSISLSGVPSDYMATINHAGVTTVRARQAGITDTLLPATAIGFTVTVNKADLQVIARNATRPAGEPNPAFILDYVSFVYGDVVADLDVMPTITCSATPTSPAGDYVIVVNVGTDDNYNLIPVNGILTVTSAAGIPNAFSPYEQDGRNDSFMRGSRMQIFNRYGVLIYETKNQADIEKGWNGRFQKNDKLVDPGVYYYVILDQDGKATDKGSVNVIKK